ncbi:MAG: DUF4411 family protein [Candidatus Aenigmarchaeota archaeon]|nr:DUF4411 family protein [Candidatus Aenigmarchaeota archaeon]
MNIYVIDTSSLIHMKKEYRLKTFKSLWRDVEDLITQKRLFAPYRVLEELKHKDDELLQWCKRNKSMFIKEDSREISLKGMNQKINVIRRAQSLISRFPQLINSNKETEDADPYVIALALEIGKQKTLDTGSVMVVANEGEKKFHIHDVCRRIGVESIRFVDIVYMEEWEY